MLNIVAAGVDEKRNLGRQYTPPVQAEALRVIRTAQRQDGRASRPQNEHVHCDLTDDVCGVYTPSISNDFNAFGNGFVYARK